MSGSIANCRARSAVSATRHWWLQRLTALALMPLALWLTFSIATLDDYQATRGWLASTWNSTLVILFVISAFHHASAGIDVIVEDYVHNHALKLGVTIIQRLAIGVMALGCIVSVLKVSLGG